MRHAEFATDLSRAQSICQLRQNRFFRWQQVRRQLRNEVSDADVGHHRITAIGEPWPGVVAVPVGIMSDLPRAPLGRIDAATGKQIMPQMVLTALEVLASRLLRPSRFHKPKMDHGFLNQIVLKSRIARKISNHPSQILSDTWIVR